MKKIIFVRHGKAEDNSAAIQDLERSLTARGKVISRLMARKLRETENIPMQIISSPAFRAIETALIFATELGTSADNIMIDDSLYHNMSLKQLPGILSRAGEESEVVIMFGHNPSFSEIVCSLCADGCDVIPKNGIAGISFKAGSWKEIRHGSGKLEYFLKPDKVL
jgi:phosphohistidine phosphatase